jgi:hypothetical protein
MCIQCLKKKGKIPNFFQRKHVNSLKMLPEYIFSDSQNCLIISWSKTKVQYFLKKKNLLFSFFVSFKRSNKLLANCQGLF